MKKIVLSLMLLTQVIVCSENKTEKPNPLFNACDGEFGSATKAFAALVFGIADVNGRNEKGETPLIYAARDNSCKLFERIMRWRKNEVDVNAQQLGVTHHTALHGVADHDNASRAQLLLSAGAHIDAERGLYQQTPLEIAICHGPELVQVLVDGGANVSHESGLSRKSPLHSLAFRTGYIKDEYAVEKAAILLKAGVEINALTREYPYQRTSALFELRRHSDNDRYVAQREALDKFLVSQGAQSICVDCKPGEEDKKS